MSKGKVSMKNLREIQKVLDSASDQKLISKEGYDQIRAAIAGKMKKKSYCWDEFEAIGETDSAPPAAEECIVVEECLVVEEDEPRHHYEQASNDAVPVESSIEPCYVEEAPQDHAADAEDREDEGVSEATVDTTGLGGDARITVQGDKRGFGFTWCIRCARVDVILYGSKTLPTELRGAESKLDNGIATIMCGCSKPRSAGSGRGKYNGGLYGCSGDVDFRSSFERLRLSPAIFGGSEVARVACAILSVEVAFITVNDGVAFKDIDEIVRGLTVEDTMMSVDMEGFRQGKQVDLLLPYLAGGLTA
jgi:hypothetical protein